MTAAYAFYIDAAFCSGCKACQVACKDKNNLSSGVLWRRVYEVSGGDWEQIGRTWTNTVFAYNLSIACNHCVHPKCAGVCPVDAYTVRRDGIVLLDSSKCIGCGYCAWACPYGAPQYDRSAGCMSKCDFCFDNIDAGLPPACVAACPMRVLEYGEAGNSQAPVGGFMCLWDLPAAGHPFPLPNYSRTQPHLAIKLHPAMSLELDKSVANQEEVEPQAGSGWKELPLIAFTLLGQMAAGGFWALSWMFSPFWPLIQAETLRLRLLPLLLVGLSIILGTVTSLTHLGMKKNVWRAIVHVRKSWLSREILFTTLFGIAWLLVTIAVIRLLYIPVLLGWLTALLGLGLVFSMSQVYRLQTVAAWNTLRTEVGFLVSAVLLGQLLMACVLAYESQMTGIQIPSTQWRATGVSTLALLAMRAWATHQHDPRFRTEILWRALLLTSMLLISIFLLIPGADLSRVSLAIFLMVLVEEVVARWLFYASRS